MKSIKRNILLNPGPATTTDSVKYAQVIPDICPRENEFTELMNSIRRDLVKIARGGDDYACILFAGSGTAAMDACISSAVRPAAKIAIVNNGAYGQRMIDIARAYRIPYCEIKFALGQIPVLKTVEAALRKDDSIKYLAMVHHETTTGILNPIRNFGCLAKKHNLVFIVDTISSFAGIPIDVKKCNIDFMFSTSNKCIQGIPAIAFIICRKSQLEKIRDYPKRSFYLDLYKQYEFFEKTGQMQFTAPVQALYALRQAIDEFFKEGAKNRYNRYTQNWKILREGLEVLGFRFLLDKKYESHILTTVLEPRHPRYDFDRMHDLLYKKGFTIYPGKVGRKKTFRLANMGAIDSRDIRFFLKALRQTLDKMGVEVLY